MSDYLIIPASVEPSKKILGEAENFINIFKPSEYTQIGKLILLYDKKSNSYYIYCHLLGSTISKNSDLEATIEANSEEEDIIYKLNREITEDKDAYLKMEDDALEGRSFEDLVIEYDTSYRETKPLKVYGGQHRIKAIMKAVKNDIDVFHGVRVYFNLNKEQKVDIAIVNNTSIAVPNDLLDRMKEQLIGTELRDWCQKVGLLSEGHDFSDKRSATVPTVRIARTLLVNFYKGLNAKKDEFHQPVVCKSGGMDPEYENVRRIVDWNSPDLIEMGMNFSLLHKKQYKTVNQRKNDNYAEYARKVLSLSVVASWAYAAGYYQRNKKLLNNFYSLPKSVEEDEDPLNAKDLSLARHKGTDPDTYRGLGTRSDPRELGRMLEVFFVLTEKARNKKINLKLANAAIQSYEAKKAQYEADKALGRI